MERVYQKSQIINNLIIDIKNGNKGALDHFYTYINTHNMPLVEKYENSDTESVVTIIYREKKKINNVVLIPPVGMRKLSSCVLEKIFDTDLWYISYKVDNDIAFTYHFSVNDPLDNDWERRFRNAEHDTLNKLFIKNIDNITGRELKASYVQMKDARKKVYINEYKNVPKGIIYEENIYSNILNENRKFYVYIPHSRKNEKFILFNDGYKYLKILHADNVLDNLMYRKEIKDCAAVFVESTKDRDKNLKCSDEFNDFLCSELLPYVKDKYDIYMNPYDNIISGYSLSALAASYTAVKNPDVFKNVISMSGSYWYKKDDFKEKKLYMISEYEKYKKNDINFYINVGKVEPKVSMIDTSKAFAEYLKSRGFKVKFDYFQSGHDYLYWGETISDALMFLCPNK